MSTLPTTRSGKRAPERRKVARRLQASLDDLIRYVRSRGA